MEGIQRKVSSVGLILCWQGNIYVVEELQEKPHLGKRVGDYSIPWETRDAGETDEQVLKRLVIEEIDHTGTIVMSNPMKLDDFDVHGTRATIYVAEYENGPERMRGQAVNDGEIGMAHDGSLVHRGWIGPGILLVHKPIRDGIRDIVEMYLRKIVHPAIHSFAPA